jgi:hypothetical protein
MTVLSNIGSGNLISINTNTSPYNTSNVIVLISSFGFIGSKLIVQDTGGNPNFFAPSAPSSILISTTGGILFLDGTSSFKMNIPFGSITCIQRTNTTWELLGTNAFTNISRPILSTLNVIGNLNVINTAMLSSLNVFGSISTLGSVNIKGRFTNGGVPLITSNTIVTSIAALSNTYGYLTSNILTSTIANANTIYGYIYSSQYPQFQTNLINTYSYVTSNALTLNIRNLGFTYLSTIDSTYFSESTSNDFIYYTGSTIATTSLISSTSVTTFISSSIYSTYDLQSGKSFTAGTLYGNGSNILQASPSDIRIKKDVELLENSLEKVNKLRGVSYYENMLNETKIGFIAQDVEEVFPEVVFTDSSKEGYKSILYHVITAPLVESIKTLDLQITDLENNVSLLERVGKLNQ